MDEKQTEKLAELDREVDHLHTLLACANEALESMAERMAAMEAKLEKALAGTDGK